MSRTTYNPIENYTGTGSLAVYTFNFKIEAKSQLEVVVMDDSDVEVQRVRGTDTVYLSSVEFDAVDGGGTVTLQANLPNNYTIYLILANDEPVQDFLFNNKFTFKLRNVELAFDYVAGAIQRLAYLAKRSIRLHEHDDADTFDMTLPPGASTNTGNVIGVNDAGTGLEFKTVNDPLLENDINVTGVTQGRYSSGDVISAGTAYETILRNMLTLDTPPVLTLAGSGTLTVESGTVINPTLTPVYLDNDAGPSNTYTLTKNAVTIFTQATPAAYGDGPFSIVDETIAYEATVDYDADIVPAGSITSNTVTYRGARVAFFQVGGDAVNIRTNSETLLNPQSGSQLSTVGDDTNLDVIFSYPDTLPAPSAFTLTNTSGTYDILGDLVTETNQLVNDASGGNAVSYKVYSYAGLIALKSSDTLTLTIG